VLSERQTDRQTDGVKACDVCVDGLVKKLEEMEKTAGTYRNLMEHTRRLLRAFFDLSQAHRGNSNNHISIPNQLAH